MKKKNVGITGIQFFIGLLTPSPASLIFDLTGFMAYVATVASSIYISVTITQKVTS